MTIIISFFERFIDSFLMVLLLSHQNVIYIISSRRVYFNIIFNFDKKAR